MAPVEVFPGYHDGRMRSGVRKIGDVSLAGLDHRSSFIRPAAVLRATDRIAACRRSSSMISRRVSYSSAGTRTYEEFVRGSTTSGGTDPEESSTSCCCSVNWIVM